MHESISEESTASTLSTAVPTAHSPRANPGTVSSLSLADTADGKDEMSRSPASGHIISKELSRCVACSPGLFQAEEEFEQDTAKRSPLPCPPDEPVLEMQSFPDIHLMTASKKRSQSSPNVQTAHTQELEQEVEEHDSAKTILLESNFRVPSELMSVNFVRASAKRAVSMQSLSESLSNVRTSQASCQAWVRRRMPAGPPPAETLAAEEFLLACSSGNTDFSDEAFTAERLKACIDEVREKIQPWKSGSIIRTLHNNPHTRATVDIMTVPGLEQGPVVVKRMPNDWVGANQEEFEKLHPHEREQPWHDLGILRHLNKIGYPFVCKLLWVFCDEENTYVASAQASEGDMHTWCRRLSRPGLTRESQLHPVARQVFSAVRWLHELGIAHRDLSLENILIQRCYESSSINCDVTVPPVLVKLCDFAMCSFERSCNDGVRGKRSYQAPEMHLEDKPYDPFLADVFALGVLLYAAAAQDYPWKSTVPDATCDRFRYAQAAGFHKFLELKRLKKTGPTMVKVFSEPLATLLEGMLHVEPEKRLTLGESCFTQPPKEARQSQTLEESVGVKEDMEALTSQFTSVWATRWLNETHRASCFGC